MRVWNGADVFFTGGLRTPICKKHKFLKLTVIGHIVWRHLLHLTVSNPYYFHGAIMLLHSIMSCFNLHSEKITPSSSLWSTQTYYHRPCRFPCQVKEQACARVQQVAHWIALTAHGQLVACLNPIKVINGVRKGIRPQLLLCSCNNTVPKPAQKIPLPGFSQGIETLNKHEFYYLHLHIFASFMLGYYFCDNQNMQSI